MKARTVIDDQGNEFRTLVDALRYHGFRQDREPSGTYWRTMRRRGYVCSGGHIITLKDTPVFPNQPIATGQVVVSKIDPLLARLKERYSEKELEMIARGEGIEKKFIPFPEIHLQGHHHKIVVMSDSHIGSVYSPEEWHDLVADYANDPKNGVECILHCGDLVEGLKISRAGTQIYELTDLGFDAQRERAINLFRKYRIPMYVISGNHDMYFKEYSGANIVKAISDAVPCMTYIGHDTADIDVDGCKIRLFHGADGSSYALSYRLQKLCEATSGGNKPNILLAGHVHKFCYILERNIHAISVPAMQMQTSFMRGKKLAAHTGFLVLEFDTENGNVCNLSCQYYPFYA